jgi:hypothetical protein
MTMATVRLSLATALLLLLGFGTRAWGQGPQSQALPEFNEIRGAFAIRESAARIKELERLKAKYPRSILLFQVDLAILAARIEAMDTLEDILAGQADLLGQAKGIVHLACFSTAANQILNHPKLATFPKAKVAAAVAAYRDAAVQAAAAPGIFKDLPAERVKSIQATLVAPVSLALAKAYLNAGNPAGSLEALAAYRKDGGVVDGLSSYGAGEALAALGRNPEALDAYQQAALKQHPGAQAKALATYVTIHGQSDGFETQFNALLRALPYRVESFTPPREWQGKAVLAELFTGSECPPCLGADLGFDGLIEAYPSKYLVVLEYHLPIPAPDPIMNPATSKRQAYYRINSTPSAIIDGERKVTGGGPRSVGEAKFMQYRSEIDARMNAAPGASLKAKALRTGDLVKVDCQVGKVDGAEYMVALVQNEEQYRGSNGIIFHKMVVRDLAEVNPAGSTQAVFDLAASEQATDQYLTEFETSYTRRPNFKFLERHNKIDRKGLKAVVFAQDKVSHKVLNALVVDVL